jgi:hypothetical protein
MIAVVVLLAVAGGAWLYHTLDSGSCAATDTTQSLLVLMQKNGRINYLEGEWVGETAIPQFARAAVSGAATLDGKAAYRCTATITVDYDPDYVKLLFKDRPAPPTAPLHRVFRVDYTPVPTGEDQDYQFTYELNPQ